MTASLSELMITRIEVVTAAWSYDCLFVRADDYTLCGCDCRLDLGTAFLSELTITCFEVVTAAWS